MPSGVPRGGRGDKSLGASRERDAVPAQLAMQGDAMDAEAGGGA